MTNSSWEHDYPAEIIQHQDECYKMMINFGLGFLNVTICILNCNDFMIYADKMFA